MQFNIQSLYDIPPELCIKPLALVGVSGLDTLNNAVHKAIWETFSNSRRTDRVPISFKLIGNAHEFPVFKPNRALYDWYVPKGILKRNWLKKHLHEIPAVMVIFYDLDWNDPLWNEKMIECASRVQSMRAALEGRKTRINVVLIQSTVSMPAGEDMLANDRAVTLCASCELNINSLFVLPQDDHFQGYALRLETAFHEFAQSYYHAEIKHVRAHKDQLNRTSHQYLFVRHQFKMGFLYELKQDNHTSHKHYSHAYDNLLEIRIVDTNALEVRTVAGFINYKLCRLMFALNLPRDAISQFKAHIDHFKNRMGFHELSFEHYAWLSKQFSVFGDIFDEAVKLGLPAVQTQHPGIYYQQAAQYAILRKQCCLDLCANINVYPQPDPLEGVSHMEYYGQQPWRRGNLSAEPPDPQLESNGIRALQYLEKQVNHSNIIVSLYGLAISQYKTYRCPRTRRHLILQMADEYFNSQDFGKTLTLLTHMLWDFRAENWWVLLTDILEKAIKCAFLTANIQDYVVLSLEILGQSSTLCLDDKKKIDVNLHRILNKQFPFGDVSLDADLLQNAVIQWQPVFTSEPLNISLDMGNILSCVETKATFVRSKYEVDQKVAVEIYIRCTSPFPLTFSKVSVTINTSSLSSEYAVDFSSVDLSCLYFQPNEIKRFVIEFLPDTSDIHKDIQIGAINLVMGNPQKCSFNLKFSTSNLSAVSSPELSHFKCSLGKVNFDNICPISSTLITPRHSKLNVSMEHSSPALLGEWYKIAIHISNDEEYDLKNLKVEADFVASDGNICISELAKNTHGIPEKLPVWLKTNENLECGGKITSHLYLRAHKPTISQLEIRISYALDKEKPVISIKTVDVSVPVVAPFEINTKFLSTLMTEISKFYVAEEVGVMLILKCLSPWPIIVEQTFIEFCSPFAAIEHDTGRLINMQLHNKETGTELFFTVCKKQCEENVTVGRYVVKWKRLDGLSTTTHLTLTGHSAEWVPLELKVTVPAHGLVRTPFLIAYHLSNRSQQLLQLDVSTEASEAFMYAGYKQFSVSILPESSRTIQYNLYPLIAGSVALPKLILTIPENSTEGPALRPEQLRTLVERSLPRHLYVMPQIKGNPKTPAIVAPRKVSAM